MRILCLNMFFPPHNAPTGHYLAAGCQALAAAGHAVSVIASKQSYLQDGYKLSPHRQENNVDVIRVWGAGLGKMSPLKRVIDYATFFFLAFVKLMLSPRIDAVVCMTSPPMIDVIGLLHRFLYKSKLVLWSMDCYPEMLLRSGVYPSTNPTFRFLKTIRSLAARRTDLAFALDVDMESLLAREGYKNIVHLYNWDDGEKDQIGPTEVQELKDELVGKNNYLVLYLGNLGAPHEFDTFLDIADGLKCRGDLRFVFVGGGTRWPALNKAIEQRQLDNVSVRDYLPKEQAAVALRTADLLLLCLRPEIVGVASPSKIYGYLAAGRPVLYVGPAESHVGRIIKEAHCGCVTAIGEPNTGKIFLERLLNEPGRIQKLGMLGRQYYQRHYGQECFAQVFRDALGSLEE